MKNYNGKSLIDIAEEILIENKAHTNMYELFDVACERKGIVKESKNKLIAQFYKKGLFEFVNGAFKAIPETTLLPEIVGIVESDDEDFYFSRMGAIFKSGKLNKPFKDYSKEFGSINTIIKLNNEGYAVGTQNNGLIILNSNFTIKHRFTKNNGLSGRTVKSVYEDGFHNLWVALNNGIDYLKMSLPFSLINEEVAIEGTGYAAHRFKDKIYK